MDDIVLVEGERREEVALTPDEVAILRTCGLVDVTPGWTAGRYAVTGRSLVGHVVLPARRLAVRPKAPLANVFAMLARVAGVINTAPTLTALDEGEPILSGIADLYARALDELLTCGGVRALVDVTEESRFVRGKLLIGQTLRKPPGRRYPPVIVRSGWTTDTLPNQLLKQAVRALLCRDLPAETRALLERATVDLAAVADASHSVDAFDRIDHTRDIGDAKPALALARWVILGCAPALEPGRQPFPAFRLDAARLFEEFIAALLSEALGSQGTFVAAQPLLRLDEAGEVPLRPDLVVDVGGVTCMVLDTKYKLPGPPRPDDLYQILAYCHALGAPVGALVFPTATVTPPLVVRQTGVTIHALGLDLGAPPERFAEVCRGLTDSIEALVAP